MPVIRFDELTAHIRNGEIILVDLATLESIAMKLAQWDEIAAFVAAHREGK